MWKYENRDPQEKISVLGLATFLVLNLRQSFDLPAKWYHQLVSVIN